MSNVLLRAWSRLWLLVALGDQISVARFGATIRCLSAASLSSGDDNPPQPYRKEVSEDSKGRCEVRESPTGSPANTERCSEQRPFSIHPEDHGLKHSWGPRVLYVLVNIQRANRSLPSWLPSPMSTCSGNTGFFKNPFMLCDFVFVLIPGVGM